MEWWALAIVAWIVASICTAIGLCRWFKWLRGDFDRPRGDVASGNKGE